MHPLLRILVFLPIGVFVLVTFVTALAVEATRDVTSAVAWRREGDPHRARREYLHGLDRPLRHGARLPRDAGQGCYCSLLARNDARGA